MPRSLGLCSPEGPRTLTKPSNVGKGEGVPAKSYTSHSTTCMFSRCSAGSLPAVIPVLLTCWPFTTVLCHWAACSTRPVVQRWPNVLARGLLPATPPYREAVFQIWLLLAGDYNCEYLLFACAAGTSDTVILDCYIKRNCFGGSQSITTPPGRLCKMRVYGPFLIILPTLLTRNPQLGAVFQHEMQDVWRTAVSFQSCTQHPRRDLKTSSRAGVLASFPYFFYFIDQDSEKPLSPYN